MRRTSGSEGDVEELRSSVEKSLWQRDDGVRRLWADGGGEEGGG